MLRRLRESGVCDVPVTIDDRPFSARAGDSVAATLLAAVAGRATAVSGVPDTDPRRHAHRATVGTPEDRGYSALRRMNRERFDVAIAVPALPDSPQRANARAPVSRRCSSMSSPAARRTDLSPDHDDAARAILCDDD